MLLHVKFWILENNLAFVAAPARGGPAADLDGHRVTG